MVKGLSIVALAGLMVLAGCSQGGGASGGTAPEASASPTVEMSAAPSETAGGSEAAPSESAQADEADMPKIVSILNGPLGDDAFFDDVQLAGMVELSKKGWATQTIEAPLNDPVTWRANLEAASKGDYDIVVVGTVQMADILKEVAPLYPDQHYLIWDMVVDAPNVTSITYAQHEGSYLAGHLAGRATTDPTLMPKSEGNKHVGVVAGMQSPIIDEFIGGFKAGVAGVDPEIKVDVAYVGSFTDANAGAQQAKALYDQGVDVIYAVAGGSSLGVAHAAKEADDYAIGVDLNMNPVEPGFVAASMVKQIGRSIMDTAIALEKGEIEWGTTQVIGLDAGLGLTFEGNDNAVPQELIDEIEATKAKIVDKSISVPTALGNS